MDLYRHPITLAQEEEDVLDTTHVYMMYRFKCILVLSKDVKNATVKDPGVIKMKASTSGWTDAHDKEGRNFFI